MKIYTTVLALLIILCLPKNIFSIENIKVIGKDFNSVKIEWDNKKQENLIIILRENNTPLVTPQNNIEYSASNDLSNTMFSRTGENNFVVYKGLDKKGSLEILNMKPKTDYEANYYSISSKKNQISYKLTKTLKLYTTDIKPTISSKSIAFGNPMKSGEIFLIWAKGNGERSIVLCKECYKNSDCNIDYPKPGEYYPADTIFGNKNSRVGNTDTYIVYEGKGKKDNKASIKGIKDATSYCFAVVEANGSLSKINYLLPVKDNGNMRCKISFINAPVALPANEIQNNSFIANLKKIDADVVYSIDVATDEEFKNILPNYNKLEIGNYDNWMIFNLKPNTTYYYRVMARTNKGNETGYSNIIKVITK